ncbi:16S rRNA (guanine(1207)-N(2))-methyltransferase RsmC [Budvicia aquatica]|uniref:Ribosomal RNA small subunit methyltransferase C n=1 Tax=Budvicia aquatica TaxID=82979 RepID=A0A2C6DLZ4_9GAMM|nr:16S rRNA (guanine(1207)-N(2))-methyltransferase RsmC [Budvicia aquatica]PHI29475.1 16S rRNA (guanine(1207)-N(2))-methyltransferase RsmC [Budvicia aquatica]VFS47763.1 Ribosomal RNA small subunit methyltransferase C [Budvicia aquatica]
MSAFCPASEVILRHTDEFTERRVLFAGDLQDELASQFEAQDVRVHCSQYHHWRQIHRVLGDNTQFGLLPQPELVNGCDTLIYYWPKSKQEAQFQLSSLLSQLPVGSEMFIVGENRSGVRSAETLLSDFGGIAKIDSARRCSLYHFRLDHQAQFNLAEWWDEYQIEDTTVKTLPGVFSRDDLDLGSKLLLSVLDTAKGKVLDVGCGAGVLSAVLAKLAPEIELTLSDVSASAIESSKATLEANGLKGNVIASDVFSDVEGRFDLIISNPPFHDGMQTSLTAAEALIRGATKHLQLGGRLIIVANAFLPYPDILDATFGSHEVLAHTGRFKVYQAIHARPTYAPKGKKHKNKR